MDVNKYLIIIKNEDKTEDIISYENNKNLINIKYKSTGKMYSYSRRDFQFYKNPTEIDIKDKRIILNQGYVYNVIKILKFESIYFDKKSSTKYYQRNFWLSKSDTFIGNDAIICYEEPFEINANQSETTITFQNFLDEEDSKYYNCLTPLILKENFKEHYLYYFCEGYLTGRSPD